MKLRSLALPLIVAGGLTLFGCNDSNSETSNTESQLPASYITVTGIASAPSGTVAFLHKPTFLEEVLSNFISPVYASMTGLEAVQNALVELIKIDDQGNQLGHVITSTYTSTTGHYQINVPGEYQLNGSLILRISGNNTEIRAQLVDTEINIDPITEYVLQKYISLGIDLSSLTTNSVVELYGKLNEFDLSSSTDLASTFKNLSENVGEFVESKIELNNSNGIDANGLDGNYRLIGHESKLVDLNYINTGKTENHIGFRSRRGGLIIDGDDKSGISVTYEAGTYAYRRVLKGIDENNTYFNSVNASINPAPVNEKAKYIDNHVITFNKDYTEVITIEDDEAERSYAEIQNFQKVIDSNVAFNLYKSASVYYGLEGTVLNEDDLTSHQTYRGLRVIAEVPQNMVQSDLIGNFGRVYLEAYADENANIDYSIENSILTFNGSSTFSSSSSNVQSVSRSTDGTNMYSTSSKEGLSNVSITVESDGNISELNGDYASNGYMNGFVNTDLNFMAITNFEADTNDENNIKMGTTLAVKLSSYPPDLNGKTYRVLAFGSRFNGKEIHLLTSTFGSSLTFTSETSGNVTSSENDLFLVKLGEEFIDTDVSEEITNEFRVNILADGSAKVTVEGAEEETTSTSTLNGYFNDTATMGVFTSSYQVGTNDPKEVGLVILIQIDRK